MKKVILICLLSLFALTAGAEDDRPDRPVTSSVMVGGGAARLTDNYLTPFKTVGWTTSLSFERIQAARCNPSRMSAWLAMSIDFGRTHNSQSTNGPVWRTMLHFEGAPLWRFGLFDLPVSMAFGPQLEVDAGIHYRPANSNNPVAAQVAVTLAPTLQAVWRTRMWRLPVSVGYHGSLQMLGVFFAPEYGELYYEIYLGNHKNLARFAWPGNRLSYRHLLYADFHIGATSLRIGYNLHALTQKASYLATNLLTNTFMIGITTTRLSINPRKTLDKNIILGL